MTKGSHIEHDAKLVELRSRYEREGYDVSIEPEKAALPFDLGSYAPDLVARKDGGGLIVEVKSSQARSSIERYQAIARSVRQHPGWRFLLVTVDDLNFPTSPSEIVSWDALVAKLEVTRSLVEGGTLEPAVLYLWSIFEAAMRRLAVVNGMPLERLSAVALLNQLYTMGYISIDDFATAKKFLSMRNGITHGFGTLTDVPLLDSFLYVVATLVDEWKHEVFENGGADS